MSNNEMPPSQKTFIWTRENLDFLRNNAGRLPTKILTEKLNTTPMVIRNRAYRMKLSLKVPSYSHSDVLLVRRLYESGNKYTLKEIAEETGLTAGVVQYILYVKLNKTLYSCKEYYCFETDSGEWLRVEKCLVDEARSQLKGAGDESDGFYEVFLTDGSSFCVRNIRRERLMTSI
ncbi:hypothetical protein AX334_23665 [Salmonella enterica]|nr:hypothetical protein [Salmonella enterica]EAY8676443.1 hypothetical protein [Salmonella enterica]